MTDINGLFDLFKVISIFVSAGCLGLIAIHLSEIVKEMKKQRMEKTYKQLDQEKREFDIGKNVYNYTLNNGTKIYSHDPSFITELQKRGFAQR